MRVRLWREGTPTTDARLIREGSVEFSDAAIPLMDKQVGGRLVGKVEKVRRERDGWVTGELVGVRLSRGFAVGASMVVNGDDGVFEDDLYRSVVVSATLKGAFVTGEPAWPGMTR